MAVLRRTPEALRQRESQTWEQAKVGTYQMATTKDEGESSSPNVQYKCC